MARKEGIATNQYISFLDFSPSIPSFSYMFMLEAMTYKVTLDAKILDYCELDDLNVFVWTNQYDHVGCEGEWHRIPLKPLEDETKRISLTFGESVVITSNRDFEFTFCAKVNSSDLVWSHGFGENGRAHVEPPRENDKWTQGPNYDHILNSVYCGNFIAATNAKECGFTHVLNVAGNLDMVYPSDQGVLYKKIPMIDGAHNPIPQLLISEAVAWLEEHDTPEHRILVNCRAGIGRAGSTVVSFVFKMKPDWSFEKCKSFTLGKRFIYPHSGLKEILHKLYPRKDR